jgi:hypothetical protein
MFRSCTPLRRLSFPTTLLALLLAAATAEAQWSFTIANAMGTADTLATTPEPTTRTANPSKSIGNSDAGASLHFPIQVSNANGCTLVKIGTKGTINLLGKKGTAAEIEASAKSCSDGTRTALVKAKVASFTVALDTKSVSFTWEQKVTRTLLSASLSLWVGPVPVTVKGSVAGALTAKVELKVTKDDAGISGPLGFSMKGTASGSLGFPGYSLGLEAVLDILTSTLTSAVKASFSSLSGTIRLCFEPVVIKLNLVVKLWPFSWTENLANYSLAKACATVLSM